MSSFDTSTQHHKTREKELPPTEQKGETVEEGTVLSLEKPNFSLSPSPQGVATSCLKMTLNLWVTSTEVQDGFTTNSKEFIQQ